MKKKKKNFTALNFFFEISGKTLMFVGIEKIFIKELKLYCIVICNNFSSVVLNKNFEIKL